MAKATILGIDFIICDALVDQGKKIDSDPIGYACGRLGTHKYEQNGEIFDLCDHCIDLIREQPERIILRALKIQGITVPEIDPAEYQASTLEKTFIVQVKAADDVLKATLDDIYKSLYANPDGSVTFKITDFPFGKLASVANSSNLVDVEIYCTSPLLNTYA